MNWALLLFAAMCVLLLINIVVESRKRHYVQHTVVPELVRVHKDAQTVLRALKLVGTLIGEAAPPEVSNPWKSQASRTHHTLKVLKQNGYQVPPVEEA